MRILTIPALVLRFARIRRRRRAAVARAVVLLLVARASLLALPFATVARAVDRTRASRRPQRRASLKDALWATKVVGDRLFPSNPCLPQALVAQYELLRRGLPAELRISVRKDRQGRFGAHAWVESAGHILMGGEVLSDGFVPLPSLPGSAPPD